jgi:hypothetical protein
VSAPEEWRLGEIWGVDVERGIPTSRTSIDGQYPVLSIAALRNGDTPTRFVDRDEMDAYGADGVHIGDVLVAIEGGTVGEAMVVTRDIEPFVPSQQVAVIRLGSSPTIDPWYLCAWLNSGEGQRRLMVFVRGAGIQRIAISDLMQIEVPVPDDFRQNAIGERYRAFQESIRGHMQVLTGLKKLAAVESLISFSELEAAGPESEITEEAPRRRAAPGGTGRGRPRPRPKLASPSRKSAEVRIRPRPKPSTKKDVG